jgi:transcriptional regulator with GAF, ATPase, and Fis domain
LLTATNVDLEVLIKANQFRADLYYRLNIFPIHVPPLRERSEDIPLLANHFLKRLGRKRGKFFNKIPKSQLNILMDYDWPGNVRELENIIERGTILVDGPEFELPERIRPVCRNQREGVTLAENEKNHILWALRKRNWKVSGPGGVAELLGIHPSTLLSRMNKLGIKRPAKPRSKTE